MTAVPPTAVAPPRPVTPAGILAAELDRLVADLGTGTTVDADWRARLEAVRDLATGLDPYLERCTSPESSALRDLAERTQAEDWTRYDDVETGRIVEQEMLSGHVEGQLLAMLVHTTRARRVLEIGMFTGYSALAMAEALPADGQVVACEIDPDVAAFARRCFDRSPAGARIDVRTGPAAATLDDLAEAGQVFDLVFLDADKAGYEGYLAAVLDTGLLSPDGLVCVDNTLMQGQPWTGSAGSLGDRTPNAAVISAFNDAVAADPRVVQVLVPLRDGLTLIRRTQES